MSALKCPLCGKRPKRDDRGEDGPNISIGYRAALKCECGLRLERYCSSDQGAGELIQLWRMLTLKPALGDSVAPIQVVWAEP